VGSQEGEQVRLEIGRSVVELHPGDADDAEARAQQVSIAEAVGLEGTVGVVRGPAVELDDQSGRRPEAVDLVAVAAGIDHCVRERSLDAALDEEAAEGTLELAAGVGNAVAEAAKGGTDGANTWLARMALQEVGKRDPAGEPGDLRFVDEELDLGRCQAGRQIEDRACGGGRRDAGVDGDLVRGQTAAMREQGRAGAELARRGDLGWAGIAAEIPEGRGGRVAEDGIGARGKDGRHPASVASEANAGDGVDAGVNPAKAAGAEPVGQHLVSEAELEGLAASKNAVLPLNERGQQRIDSKVRFPVSTTENRTRVDHGTDRGPQGHTGGTSTETKVTRKRTEAPQPPTRSPPQPQTAEGTAGARGRPTAYPAIASSTRSTSASSL
jgi:hypothetical protein